MEQNVNNYTVENSSSPMGNRSMEIAILILGIASLAASSIGVGLVCGIIGLVLASNYRKEYNTINTMVNIGRGLSIAGIIVGAVAIVILVCCIGCLCTSLAGVMGASLTDTNLSSGFYY